MSRSRTLHERALTDLRRQEERREDQHRCVARERQIRANLKNEERVEMKRYVRQMQDEECERQMEEAFLKVWCSSSPNGFAFYSVRLTVEMFFSECKLQLILIPQAEQDRMYKEKLLEQEERMAKELARISYEKTRDEKMRQYVKENRCAALNMYSMSLVVILLCTM